MNQNRPNIWSLLTLVSTIIGAIFVSVFFNQITGGMEYGDYPIIGILGIVFAWVAAGAAVFTLFAKDKAKKGIVFGITLSAAIIAYALTAYAPCDGLNAMGSSADASDPDSEILGVIVAIQSVIFICNVTFASIYEAIKN